MEKRGGGPLVKETKVTREIMAGDQPQKRGGANWRDLPAGAVIAGGANSAAFETGDWRTLKPVHLPERCIHCLLCWVFCPDMAVIVEDGRVVGFDYKHCKGCGICAKECPSKVNAIDMVPEGAEDADRSTVSEYRGKEKSR
jgi:pyruvate ferredoxin oxidoreductase delta subunit